MWIQHGEKFNGAIITQVINSLSIHAIYSCESNGSIRTWIDRFKNKGGIGTQLNSPVDHVIGQPIDISSLLQMDHEITANHRNRMVGSAARMTNERHATGNAPSFVVHAKTIRAWLNCVQNVNAKDAPNEIHISMNHLTYNDDSTFVGCNPAFHNNECIKTRKILY